MGSICAFCLLLWDATLVFRYIYSLSHQIKKEKRKKKKKKGVNDLSQFPRQQMQNSKKIIEKKIYKKVGPKLQNA